MPECGERAGFAGPYLPEKQPAEALALEVKMGAVPLDLPLTSLSLKALTSKMDQNIL